MRSRLFALVLLGACGDNARGLPLEEVDQARQEAECARFVRCGLFASEDSCMAYFRLRDNRSRDAAVAAGSVGFNGVAAEKCFRALAEASCDATTISARDADPSCAQIFTGKYAAGTSCELDVQCASGVCDQPACARDVCCEGVCSDARSPRGPGETCADDQDCQHGTFCGRDFSCHVLGASGAACDADNECDYDLACIGPGVDPGTCRPVPKLGEACPYLRCAEIGALCSASQICVPSGFGAACASDADCSFYSLCDLNSHTCGSVPLLGQPCVSRCADTAWCDRSGPQHVCAAPLETMAACTTDQACESRLCEEGPIFDYCADAPICY